MQKKRTYLNYAEYIGKTFNDINVLDYINVGKSVFKCVCSCGTLFYSKPRDVVLGHKKSCGCRRFKHRDTGTKEYFTWIGMKSRCYSESSEAYPKYGGRGIKICDRWLESYNNFLEDMGRAPTKSHSIDRIDNNGNYSPVNCRWATRKQQARNTRLSLNIEYCGITDTIGGWAERVGVSYSAMEARLRRGWSLGKALNTETVKQLQRNNKGRFIKC